MVFFRWMVIMLLAGMALVFFVSEAPIDEGANVFSSEVYHSYHQELKGIIENHSLYRAEHPLAKAMLLPIETAEQRRVAHSVFVQTLRQLAQENDPLTADVTRWVFLNDNLDRSIQDFVFQHLGPLEGDVMAYLKEGQRLLHDHSPFNGRPRHATNEDNYLHGNLPSALGYHAGVTRVLRFGLPISNNRLHFWSGGEVNPEFLLFIRQQPSHLYVNLMKRFGRENKGTGPIEALEAEIANFYVITLDKDSSFYHQKDSSFQGPMLAATFKNHFLKRLQSSDYHWSVHLDASMWFEELKQVLDEVHQVYFNNQEFLTPQERRDFIELTYLAAIDHLTEKWHPASMNFSCHEAIDRGPSLLVLWLFQHEEVSDEAMAAWLLGSPILMHNRAAHGSRIERFISAARRIYATRL